MSTDIFPAITSKHSVKQRVPVWKHVVFHDYVIPADAAVVSGIFIGNNVKTLIQVVFRL